MNQEQSFKKTRGNFRIELEYLGNEEDQGGNLSASFSMKRTRMFGGKEIETWRLIGSMATNLPRNASEEVVMQRADRFLSALEAGPAPNEDMKVTSDLMDHLKEIAQASD